MTTVAKYVNYCIGDIFDYYPIIGWYQYSTKSWVRLGIFRTKDNLAKYLYNNCFINYNIIVNVPVDNILHHIDRMRPLSEEDVIKIFETPKELFAIVIIPTSQPIKC